MFAFWWGMRRVLPTVIQIQGGGLTLKYKVSFSGFAYVEADSPEEAEEKAMYEDDAVYEEKKCESVEEVDEFTVSLENCMERLTYWNEEYGCWSYHGPSGEAAKRLAAYEDTGLEPEEIGALKSREKGLVELLNGVSCGCAVTYTRLRELAQADREGRCVVLPAKPDQTIYQWRIGDDCPSVSRLDGVQINADGEITYPIWNGYLIAEDFGRTVFLTREEAALRREQDG
jgi:hypothetical protein|nr:MAG TPA: hypothetical protein [Caudoviricetes sp.]